MRINYSNPVSITNTVGKKFSGVFVGSIEYAYTCYDIGGGEYDYDTDYCLAFMLETGEIICALRSADGEYGTWSLKGMSFRIIWDSYSDYDKIPEEARAQITFEPVPFTMESPFVAIETDELPF